jgi:hypothetical protein
MKNKKKYLIQFRKSIEFNIHTIQKKINKVSKKKKIIKYVAKIEVRHFIIGYVCTNKKYNEKDLLSDHLLFFLPESPPDFRAFFVGDE